MKYTNSDLFRTLEIREVIGLSQLDRVGPASAIKQADQASWGIKDEQDTGWEPQTWKGTPIQIDRSGLIIN